MSLRAFGFGLMVVTLGATTATSAQSVGYQCYGCSVGGAEITAAGYTAVDGNNVSVFDFNTVDMFVHLNGDNGSFSTDFTGRSADVFSWLNAGGRLMVFDRYVGATDNVAEPSWLPWLSFTATRALDVSIDVLGTAGAFGNGLTNATLDGGNFSTHGFATGLPVGSVGILSTADPAHYAAFYAAVGAGFVFYSTVPMDFYLGGGGNGEVGDAFRDWFPTVLDAMDGLESESTVPEPATMTLLATGLAGMAAARRRKR